MSEFTDVNADQVHGFALEMGNLGLARVADLVTAMLESDAWRSFQDGTGTYRFLPGEFDYFLTQQGVTREQILHGIRDIGVKARLEEAMDERRTGEDGYRRRLVQIRTEVPERPGRPIEPFGYSVAEARAFTGKATAREPLGRAPRQYRLSGGTTTRRPNELGDPAARLRQRILRLADADLRELRSAIDAELSKRDVAGA